MVYQEKAAITAHEEISAGLFRLSFHAPEIALAAAPGQFVMLRISDNSDPLLRRPFSVHRTYDGGIFQILFRVVGRGSRAMSVWKPGQLVDVLGPLGRGFVLVRDRPIVMLAGGMGIAPMAALAPAALRLAGDDKRVKLLVGARSANEIRVLADECMRQGLDVAVATDDGSMGHHGLVTELLEAQATDDSVVYACGPYAMLRATAAICRRRGQPCQLSLETVMACGVGACLGCALPRPGGGFLHVCKDGPVFAGEELAWR